MPDVKELLAERSDLSTFLVHFTRVQDDGTTGRDVLLKILNDQTLKATRAHGMAKSRLDEMGRSLPDGQSVPHEVADRLSVVCMSEAPMPHWSMLCADIPGRSCKFSPYGLVFSKTWALRHSFNPVWYLNTTPGQTWLTTPVNELAELATEGKARAKAADGGWEKIRFRDSQIARLLPFIETAGVGKDFSWEREWRRVGSVAFLIRQIVAVLAPETDHLAFQAAYERQCEQSESETENLNLVDPTWPLARIKSAFETHDSSSD